MIVTLSRFGNDDNELQLLNVLGEIVVIRLSDGKDFNDLQLRNDDAVMVVTFNSPLIVVNDWQFSKDPSIVLTPSTKTACNDEQLTNVRFKTAWLDGNVTLTNDLQLRNVESRLTLVLLEKMTSVTCWSFENDSSRLSSESDSGNV